MVDISSKPDVPRIATAMGKIKLRPETIRSIIRGEIKKGDPLTNAKYAAVNAVKQTSSLVFLAHPIPIMNVEVKFSVDEKDSMVAIEVTVKSIGKTGVELEALSGVMLGLLAIWDMCKYLEKNDKGQYDETEIISVKVLRKEKILE